MSLVLGICKSRVQFSDEALGMSQKALKEEAKKYLDRCRLLGISTGILLRDEYNITFSEKRYMLFGNRPCHYHIEDDTEIVCPRFTKGFEVYAGVNSISIDAKTYSSKKVAITI